ncbi:ribosome maturation factor RimM [Williamsia serinedens]|uniref:Ribosome maturation factor RimM n=1 Tax=Williamsia serinedens TaxID=391736 RepID=A0ABT1GVE4_9NOCA|nr:ribosome maturation factor RimM [Williamsia serinedens]MCP2158953.1 16S rRNA processing protein RimM [Williamsia serinedens]
MDLAVGRIVKSHGVRGEVVVDVRTDDPDARFAPGTVLRGKLPRGAGERSFGVVAARDHGDRLLVRLEGVDDRTAADDLRGVLLVVDADSVDSGDDPDEFYDHEIIGVPVRTVAGDEVGTLADVLHLPGGDTLVVAVGEGDARREVLVPFVAEMVPTVTTEVVEIDPPDGLLDL